MNPERFKTAKPRPQRPLVDPFVRRAGQPPLHPQPAAPKPRPVGISGVDGFVPAKPANHAPAVAKPDPTRLKPKPSQPALPAKPRPLPRGPLHLQHQSIPTRKAAPQPRQHGPPATGSKAGAAPVSEAEAEIVKRLTQAPKVTPTKKARAKKAAKMSGWALVGMLVIAGLSLFSQAVGEAALAVYAIVALWWRWPSQQTFALALAMFVGIILTSLASSFNLPQAEVIEQVSKNLAVYAFLLLCIGTVALAREVRSDGHHASPHS